MKATPVVQTSAHRIFEEPEAVLVERAVELRKTDPSLSMAAAIIAAGDADPVLKASAIAARLQQANDGHAASRGFTLDGSTISAAVDAARKKEGSK